MKGITIKLPEGLLQRLAAEARASGRSIAAVVRSRLETPGPAPRGSVHAQAADLAGSLAGSTRSATNDRRRFRR
ncbi:MAG TPA: hypothetical protein VMB48_03025 [Steroidobacteraceae bacterium]|nr:hypothetical protein [Steroidobacteraceae bacterium]